MSVSMDLSACTACISPLGPGLAPPESSAQQPVLFFDAQPLLWAVSSAMVAIVLVSLLLDRLQTTLQRADKQNRKKNTLDLLRRRAALPVVSAEPAFEPTTTPLPPPATIQFAEHLQLAEVLDRQSTLCATSSNPRRRSPACSPVRGPDYESVGLELTTSAKNKTAGEETDESRRRETRRANALEGGDPAFSDGPEWQQPSWSPDPECLAFKASV